MSLTSTAKMRVVLLDIGDVLPDKWRTAICRRRLTGVDVEVFQGQLPQLGAHLSFVGRTTIVSPGNAAGRMGGGFDKSLARFFRKDNDWMATEKRVRQSLGCYVPLGTANLVEFDEPFYRGSQAWATLHATSVIHVPTMRVPRRLWDDCAERWRGFVFDCVWAALLAVRRANERSSAQYIDTVVIPGLGSGYGELPAELVADAMVTAIAIFFDDTSVDDKTDMVLRYLESSTEGDFFIESDS